MIPLRFAGESLNGDPNETIIDPQTPQTPVVSSGDWAGVWYTDFGRMDLVQNGSNITGQYEDAGYKYTIKGTINGDVFTGTYSEDGNISDFKFILNDEGNSFSGTYDVDTGNWGGKQDRDPNISYLRILLQPADWTSIWDTSFDN